MTQKTKSTKKSAKQTTRRSTKRRTTPSSQKVDYYPNRMTLAVSALAGTLIVLLAIITVYGSRG